MAIGLTDLAGFNFSRVIDEYEQNGQNIWQSSYQRAMLPYEQELSGATNQFEYSSEQLKKDYSEAINKAYESYVVNKRAAEFSNYGTGDVRNIVDAFRKSYEENKRNMFDTYLENQSSLDTQYSKALSSYYQQALSTQNLLDEQKSALETNFDAILDSSHKYLSDLLLSNPLLFNSNPLLNQFTYVNDETGQTKFVDYTTFIELLTDPETGSPKEKGGIEDLINLITSLGGKNQKDITSYQSYLMNNKDYTSLHDWLLKEQGLYTMYDILGFDSSNLYRQGTETQDTLAVTYGEGDNQRTMYKYVDYSTGKTYEPLDPTNFTADGNDNIMIYGDSYDLQNSKTETDRKISGILNIMSSGSTNPDKDVIAKGTVQIYDDNIYKFDGEKWIKMVDGDYKVSEIIDKIQTYRGRNKDDSVEGLVKVNEQNPAYNKDMSNSIYKLEYDVPLIHTDKNNHKFYAGSKPGTFAQIKTEYVKINNNKYWLKPEYNLSDIKNKLKNDPYKIYKFGDKYYIYGTYNTGNSSGLFEIENFKGE